MHHAEKMIADRYSYSVMHKNLCAMETMHAVTTFACSKTHHALSKLHVLKRRHRVCTGGTHAGGTGCHQQALVAISKHITAKYLSLGMSNYCVTTV